MFLPGGEGTDRVRSATWPADEDVGDPDLVLPIEHAGEPIGDLAVTKTSGDPLRPTERTLLEDLASHAGIGLENARLSVDLARRAEELAAQTDELRRSRERLVTVRDAQRHRLEHELRDGVGAEIAGIRDEIRDDAGRVVADPDGVRASLEELSGRTTVALDDLREVARGIFPPLLSDEGLAAALGALARRSGPDTQLSILGGSTGVRYDAAVEAAIYFCCVQALQNAERHAAGRRVDVTLTHGPGEVAFSVRDRGAGFEVDRAASGEGLQIMRDRMAALGGSLSIESALSEGTTVTGTLPARAVEVVG